MAFIQGLHLKGRQKYNHVGYPVRYNSKYKADYRPREQYNTSTTNVGGFVLHEVQLVSPQSIKSSQKDNENIDELSQSIARKERKERKERKPKNEEFFELLEPVVKRKRGRPRKVPELSSTFVECTKSGLISPNIFNEVTEETFNAELFEKFHTPSPQQEPEFDDNPM